MLILVQLVLMKAVLNVFSLKIMKKNFNLNNMLNFKCIKIIFTV